MKIYVSHSSDYDYENKIYKPLRESKIAKDNTLVFPHEGNNITNTKNLVLESDLVVAEVSLPSTGQGIELGWVNLYKVPVVCLYEKGKSVSSSLKFICGDIIEYENSDDMIEKIEEYLNKKYR